MFQIFLKKTILLLLPLIICGKIFADEKNLVYGIDAKQESYYYVKNIQIFGDRFSGTDYLQKLIEENFQGVEITNEFGNTQCPAWFNHPFNEKWGVSEKCHTLENNDETLFIVIFKDPYSWITCFQNTPWRAFIRSPFNTNLAIERNPETGQLFPNLLKQRNAKIQNMLSIKEKALNVYYINYEVLKNKPQEVLKEISNLFYIEMNNKFKPVLLEEPNCVSIGKSNLRFINSQIDWNLERKIGYAQRG